VDDSKNKLSYTYLKAPFSGVIARRFVDNFQEVKPGEPIASIQDVSQIEVLVDVPENVIAEATRGNQKAKAVAIFPTLPDKQYPLSVKEVATEADSATQTYQVVLQMPQPEEINVFPGMTATVIVTFEGADVRAGEVLIPTIAVMGDPEGKGFVWVVDPKVMTVKKTAVTIGRLSGSNEVKIDDGLKGGETIVVAGVMKLQDGMKVRLWDQQ
jgi:RND family efflux transporter MFP subunit